MSDTTQTASPASSGTDLVKVDLDGEVATITINRPKALNALNSEVLGGIHAAVTSLQGEARGIVVTGAGDKAFVAGADIAEMVDCDADAAQAFSRKGQLAFQALRDFPGPAVAAVNGFALGGGLEVALGCDIIVASEKAKLGLPETTLGLIPGFGGTQRLPRRVGPGLAKKLMFTGKPVDAATAERIGLVDQVCTADELMVTAAGIIESALQNGPRAIVDAKRLVDEGMEMETENAIQMEADAFGQIFETADAKEGMAAFLEKRKPTWNGD